ncbi:hypothetical protein [Desulfatitalea alkaliphila]|uniref:Uncharacterized protein n=1 Tax=Desulfatitalea alkaliphila TaxID=2929485 RepID=A0AA41R3L6_9BACT|nr:hypothetical protein [Desulfatitalea alkaliphila]MCJ8502577.1 hypothetical protein [Desulfatitalea alkaliphila]
MVRATREFKNFDLIGAVSKDCCGVFTSYNEIDDLDQSDAPRVLDALREIVGRVTKKERE